MALELGITFEQAQAETAANKNYSLIQDINAVTSAIQSASSRGSNKAMAYKISDQVIDLLQEEGFHVEQDISTYDTPVFVISW